MSNDYYVYILRNHLGTVLYTGVTNDLIRRVYEHKNKLMEGFTKQYNVDRLVYYEVHSSIEFAITREKQIKAWKREWKENLIMKFNPRLHDLYETLN
jgi:putative endonuclease